MMLVVQFVCAKDIWGKRRGITDPASNLVGYDGLLFKQVCLGQIGGMVMLGVRPPKQ